MSLLDQKLMQGFPQAPRKMMFSGFGGQQPMAAPVAPAAPSKWAAGGGGWDALSSIGNTLMTLSGNPALAAAAQQNQAQRHQMQQFDRAQAIRAQTAQQDRALDYQDWVNKQLFEREHPAPIKNDTVNDYNFLLEKLGQGPADQYLRNFAAGPITAVEGFDAQGNPTKTFVPRGSLGGVGAGSATAPRAVSDKAAYDALPPGTQYVGPDGRVRVKGGATPNGSRPF